MLVAGMILAAAYALGEYFQPRWLNIEWRIPWHGLCSIERSPPRGRAAPSLNVAHFGDILG
jgi:hypothetical protein